MKTLIHSLLCVSIFFAGTPFSQAASPSTQSGSTAVKKSTPIGKTKVEKPDKGASTGSLKAFDVTLSGKKGVLLGQVVDPTGAAVAGVPVALRAGNRPLALSTSNEQGHFAFANLRGGIYQVIAAGELATFRAWSAGTAPKSAQPKVVLVVHEKAVRAQQWPERGRWRGLARRRLSNPAIIAGIVGTAIAVPLAVQGSKANGNGSATGVPEATENITEGPASK